MNNFLSIIVIIFIFVVTYYFGQFFRDAGNNEEQEVHLAGPDCNPAKTSCQLWFSDGEIVVQFLQQPSALQPFEVEVTPKNMEVEKVNISFVMKDMDMGINAYNLDRQSNEIWRAKVILPVCSLGRNDWIAELRVKVRDKILRTDLAFK